MTKSTHTVRFANQIATTIPHRSHNLGSSRRRGRRQEGIGGGGGSNSNKDPIGKQKQPHLHEDNNTDRCQQLKQHHHDQPRRWPVLLYRFSMAQGWRRMVARNAQGQIVAIGAVPLAGCIVFPQIQVRIRWCHQQKQREEPSNMNPESASPAAATTATTAGATAMVDPSRRHRRHSNLVIRRGNRVCIQASLRTMVLCFRNIQESIEFTDRLLELNPIPTETRNTPSSTSSNTKTVTDIVCSVASQQRPLPTEPDEMDQNLLFYMTRLMHEDAFTQLVDRLERTLTSTHDGCRMLDALVAAGRPTRSSFAEINNRSDHNSE